ncbi:hypothetical protein QYE76_015475 [Lolium multiflorum]|uniref:Uncharacterized protein n=1 Tax=Lolium multiflorum TaxID=4521 RepID=A0AAD8X6F6_LOLMU|nr:hypothetical protein QYE76_015475 [Lolium multiflorum]
MSTIVETAPTAAPMSTPVTTTTATTKAEEAPIAPGVGRRGWVRRLVTREYVPARISRRCKSASATGSPSSSSYKRLASLLSWSKTGATAAAAATAAGGAARPPPSSYRRLASSLSRSFKWKRLPGLPSLGLRAGSASALLDEVTFRVMYVVEAVVLGLALSCFFLCCGCHI